MNTIAIKGGGRNRAERLRRAERKARRYPCVARSVCVAPGLRYVYEPELVAPVDLSGTWTPELARVALTEYADSGKSQKAFAAERGFPVGRLATWRKRLEASA